MPVDTTHPDKLVLSLEASQSVAEIFYWGATVTSWRYASHERLFLSSKAITDGSKAIRGGIPLVFPQFGANPGAVLPQHGFARLSRWTLIAIETDNPCEVRVVLGLKPDAIPASQRAVWQHDFELRYTVSLIGPTLQTSLSVKNVGSAPFEFDSLLHTYLRVKNIDHVQIHGLTGYPFVDKVAAAARTDAEPRTAVKIAGEVDRVYERVKNDYLTIDATGVGNGIAIHKTGFSDVVVWNPWTDKAKAMADFGDDEFHEMVCVEVGNVAGLGKSTKLAPGEQWTGKQSLIAML